MQAYNYLVYLIDRFYSPKEKGALWSASAITGGLQAMNLLTVYILLSVYFPALPFSKLISLLVVVVVIIMADIRYVFAKKNFIERMEINWQNLSDAQKTRIRALSLLYITLSICFFFGAAIFGSKQ